MKGKWYVPRGPVPAWYKFSKVAAIALAIAAVASPAAPLSHRAAVVLMLLGFALAAAVALTANIVMLVIDSKCRRCGTDIVNDACPRCGWSRNSR